MSSLIVAGTNQPLQKYPNDIILEIIKNNFPNPLSVVIFENDVDLIPYNFDTHEGDIKFINDQYLENTDYQISVLDDNTQPTKVKESLGRNALWRYTYKPMINVWVRQNTDTRPTVIVDKIKEVIDTIITVNESPNVYGVHRIWCELPMEFLEREFTTTDEEELSMQSTWHTKIQCNIEIFFWVTDNP